MKGEHLEGSMMQKAIARKIAIETLCKAKAQEAAREAEVIKGTLRKIVIQDGRTTRIRYEPA